MEKNISIILILAALFALSGCIKDQTLFHPNVILIITDDQGYGDLGVTGNPHVKTPNIDKLAGESIRFNQFYVSPVCAPTRASLMTGRYSLRTGIKDTNNGGARMAATEITIAEMLQKTGYKTGIFGKWHLGDNYPFRPMDQGFDVSTIHLSGGMGQPGDITTFFRRDSSYFDPILWCNGEKKSYSGYVSDIFTNEAIEFIEKNQHVPFFCYLSYNAPHTPLLVPEEYYNIFKDIDPSSGFENNGYPITEMSEQDKEAARKVYAMVTNIDDNIGRLLYTLNELDIAENTLVIFMTDNGPAQLRYNAGMRGRKSDVYRGGIRVPFFWKMPALFGGNRTVETVTAHIDLLPTLSELCNAEMPDDRIIDGKSFLPLLNNENAVAFEDRSLFFYWTRRAPELYNNIALQKGPYKLIGNVNFDAQLEDYELFNIHDDEYEQQNIIASNITMAAGMKSELDQLLYELTNSPHLQDPPRIIIGSEHENPIVLTRNDASGMPGIWTQEEAYGTWRVKILEGNYNIRFKFIKPLETVGKIYLETGSKIYQQKQHIVPSDIIEMTNVSLPETECELIPRYITNGKYILPLWIEIEKIGM